VGTTSKIGHARGVGDRDVQMSALGDLKYDVHAATVVSWFEDDLLSDGTVWVGALQEVGCVVSDAIMSTVVVPLVALAVLRVLSRFTDQTAYVKK
jgi:hypothetical protein